MASRRKERGTASEGKEWAKPQGPAWSRGSKMEGRWQPVGQQGSESCRPGGWPCLEAPGCLWVLRTLGAVAPLLLLGGPDFQAPGMPRLEATPSGGPRLLPGWRPGFPVQERKPASAPGSFCRGTGRALQQTPLGNPRPSAVPQEGPGQWGNGTWSPHRRAESLGPQDKAGGLCRDLGITVNHRRDCPGPALEPALPGRREGMCSLAR